MKLFYKTAGEGAPLLVLHGLMGMLDNWQTPTKTLAQHFQVFTIDARNHGHSPHDDAFSYQVMMEDLLELVDDLGLTEFHLLGHSMGGKTAMKFAQNYPDLINKLIIADIAPKAYPVHHQPILDALSAVDLENTARRSEAEKVLANYLDDRGVRQFLLKNLYWKDRGQLAWRFNLPVIKAVIADIGEAVMDRLYEGPTLFIRGAKSDYIQDADWPEIETIFPDSELVTLKNAGHWVHAEQPKEFLEAVLAFLKD
ncbi:MAG: alpha/beta fold hydrolase [Salibacteraceae bacterium]